MISEDLLGYEKALQNIIDLLPNIRTEPEGIQNVEL